MGAVYGFKGIGLEALAAALEQACGVTLHQYQSPMIGPWYSDVDMAPMFKALREGRAPAANLPPAKFELLLNDPEPGYQGPQFGGGFQCLLRYGGKPEDLPALEAQLTAAGLKHQRLK